MYSVEFRLNLSDVGNENLNISKTALIPTGLFGGRIEEFMLSGHQARTL